MLSNLQDALTSLHDVCPNAKLFVTGILPRTDSKDDPRLARDLLSSFCDAAGFPLIQFPSLTRDDIRQDGVHLNFNGVSKVCQAFRDALGLKAKRPPKRAALPSLLDFPCLPTPAEFSTPVDVLQTSGLHRENYKVWCPVPGNVSAWADPMTPVAHMTLKQLLSVIRVML